MSYHRIASALRLAVSKPRHMTGLSALARAPCRQKQAPPVPVLDSDCSSSWQDMTPLGTGEAMVVLSFRAAAGMGAAFERVDSSTASRPALAEVSEGGEPCFSSGGMLVPHAHTLGSMLQSLSR